MQKTGVESKASRGSLRLQPKIERNELNAAAKIESDESDPQSPPVAAGKLWIGRIMSSLPALFLLMDGIGKLVKPKAVVEGTIQLGYPESVLPGLGIVLLICTILHVVPGTTVLGAILLTDYLGGAIATHVRVGNPLASQLLFPVYVAVMLWSGLFVREPRLRALIPWRSSRRSARSARYGGHAFNHPEPPMAEVQGGSTGVVLTGDTSVPRCHESAPTKYGPKKAGKLQTRA